jgi:hypothetical protein
VCLSALVKHDDYSSDQQSGRNISKVLCDMEGACGICAGHGPPENVQSKGVPQSSLFLIVIFDPLTDFDFVYFRKEALTNLIVFVRLNPHSRISFHSVLPPMALFFCPFLALALT